MANDSEESGDQQGGLPEGRALLDWLRPCPENVTMLRELRRNPVTRAILDGNRDIVAPADRGAASGGSLQPRPAAKRTDVAPVENDSGVLRLIVDYANGMTSQRSGDG